MMAIYEKHLVRSNGLVNKECRAEKLNQKPYCIWLTGLSGSGKSTLAYATEHELYKKGKHVYVLDGDNIRHGLNCDLGFSDVDRNESVRRVTEVARLMVDAGLIVIVAFISPFKNERLIARRHFEVDEFFEVFVDAPLLVCEQRDVKGLYKKARAGDIPFFTGISSSYELPEQPELHLKTDEIGIAESVENIIKTLNI